MTATTPPVGQERTEQPLRTAVPADVDQPDRIAWGLTARQLATLAIAGTSGYGLHQLLTPLVPQPLLAAATLPVAGLVIAVVLGRRDGLGLDTWLLAAARFGRTPRRRTPTPAAGTAVAAGLVQLAGTPPPAPAPLRLPTEAITPQGTLLLPGRRRTATVAAGTVNLGLRTSSEQAALIAGFGRWLNSLSAPAQIVVSTQPVDLHAYATAVARQAQLLPNPALAAAAGDHARYLTSLAASRDPLRRQVLVVVHTEPGQPAAAAARRGADTARALTGLGVRTRQLDGPAVVAALTAAVDPYTPPVPGRRATPEAVITTERPTAEPHTDT
jgi:hypothetical protein